MSVKAGGCPLPVLIQSWVTVQINGLFLESGNFKWKNGPKARFINSHRQVNKLPRCKHTRYLEEESYFNENHPFSNFPPKYEASLGELNPIEIKISKTDFLLKANLWKT